MTFNGLHKNSYPLILCNVWVVNSAKIAEKIAFQAILVLQLHLCLATTMERKYNLKSCAM